MAAFVFSPSLIQRAQHVKVNVLGSHQMYLYHHDAWAKQDGLFFTQTKK